MPAVDPRAHLDAQLRRRVLARLEQAEAMMDSLGFFSRLIANMAETGEDRPAAQTRRAA